MSGKPRVLFRKRAANHYTLAALVGLLDDRLDPGLCDVRIVTTRIELENELAELPFPKTVIAYSFATFDFPEVALEIKGIKAGPGKDAVIICGGPHCSSDPQAVLAAGADYAFMGEGEESLPAFLGGFLKEGILPAERAIRPRPLGDFDSYPPFAHKRRIFGPIELIRGCSNRCTYCQTPRHFPVERKRSRHYVLKYAETIASAGFKRIFFTVPDALAFVVRDGAPDPQGLEDFLQDLKGTGLQIYLGCFPSEIAPGPAAACPESLGIIKRYASNSNVIIGAQSGSDKMLKVMGRPHTAADVRLAVKAARKAGFEPLVDILFGVPGEGREECRQTLSLIGELSRLYQAKAHLHFFLPLPGTPLGGKQPLPLDGDTANEISALFDEHTAYGDFFRQYAYSIRGGASFK